MVHELDSGSLSDAKDGFTRDAFHLKRRLFHMSTASILPVLALVIEQQQFLVILLTSTVAFVSSDIARLRVKSLNEEFQRLFRFLLRESERRRLTGASYVLLGTLGSFALYSQDAAILSVLFTALGDPIAGLVGVRARGKRFAGKSPWGTLAMIIVGLGVVALLDACSVIPYNRAAIIGAIVAGIVELLPLPSDDNLRVPLIAGAVMTLTGM